MIEFSVPSFDEVANSNPSDHVRRLPRQPQIEELLTGYKLAGADDIMDARANEAEAIELSGQLEIAC